MNILGFTLTGDIAFWRDFEDSVGNLSCLGPAPSHIVGIIGAAFGWSATNRLHNQKGEAPWPYAAELQKWVQRHKPKVAARLRHAPARIALNTNGFKNAKTLENTRFQQTVLENPSYQIALYLENEEELALVRNALSKPVYRICMGSQFCPAFVSNLEPLDEAIEDNWATFTRHIGADTTPLTVVDLEHPTNRVHKAGYWNYLPENTTRLIDALQNVFHRSD